MNGKYLGAALLSVALAGCGQAYTPSSGASVPGVVGGGDVLGGSPDSTVYKTAPYEVLRYTLVNTLNLGAQMVAANAATICGVADPVAGCPLANPVGFMDANKAALGVPDYGQQDPLATQVPTMMTSAGFKVWDIAASSACGRMMADSVLYKNGQPVLFPDGNYANYSTLYVSLLGRMPSSSEVTLLDGLQSTEGAFTGTYSDGAAVRTGMNLSQAKGAAVCSSILGSMEFLTAN